MGREMEELLKKLSLKTAANWIESFNFIECILN